MHTFHHYYLTAHLSRLSGHDTYLAYPASEPKHQVVLKVFDAACVAPETTLKDVRRMETRLQDLKHPHIVAILELGIEQGKPYIVSEYQEGGSLRQYLNQLASEHLSLEDAVGVVMQVGQATAFAHTHGLLHLNIRPENILLDGQGTALLTDFSMGSIIEEGKLPSNSQHHIMSYLAPEQVDGAASAASDQYALGCLLYEIITRADPDPSALRFHATLSSLVPSTTLPALPHQIEAVVLRTLALKPQERYPDIATFLAELKSAVQPEAPAFPFAHLTSRYQQPPSTSDTTGEFPSLVPITPFGSQSSLDESLSQMSSTFTSLEAFLTTPELDGISILDRLALVDGQEDASIASGVSSQNTSVHQAAGAGAEKKALAILPMPSQNVDVLSSPHDSFLLVKEHAPNLANEDNIASSRGYSNASVSQTAFLDMPYDLRNDSALLSTNRVSRKTTSLSLPALTSSDNHSIPPVSPPPTFSPPVNTGFWHHKQNIRVILLLMLLNSVIVALLLFPFHQTITGMIWHAFSTAPSSITQIRPTALPKLTALPRPTIMPKPTAISKPTALPRPTATPILSQPINPTPTAQPIPTPTPTPSYGSVQINAGGTGVGAYSADMDYQGGSVWSTHNTVDLSGVSDPAPESVYQTSRYSYDFIYLIPNLTPHQAYTVRLHFAAMSWTQKGQNVFNVTINGNTALGYFDINAAAGGTNKAVVKSFTEIARDDGTILMEFDADQGYVIVSGIQVLAN